MIRYVIAAALIGAAAGCGGTSPSATDPSTDSGTAADTGPPSLASSATTGHTGAAGTTPTADCDRPLDCTSGCATFDPEATSYAGYASVAVDCAEGGHALLRDELFGVNAYFDAAGDLIARKHVSDVAEFCDGTAHSYWEGDPVDCTPTCAYGGTDGYGYATSQALPDCGT